MRSSRLVSPMIGTLVAALALLVVSPAAARTLAPGAPLFDYVAAPLSVQELSVVHHHGVDVHDITFTATGSDPVSAYLVTPDGPGPYAGVEWAHWLGAGPTANRTEFLHEAVRLARQGVVSILPQQTFPFFAPPSGDQQDVDRIVASVVTLRRGLDLLAARSDVDPSRLALVGHDYGAMYSSLAAAVDARVKAVILMAPDSTFSNWFNTYWLQLDPGPLTAYQQLLAPLDPIAYVGYEPPLLFQFAGRDAYVPASVRDSLVAAASLPVTEEIFANQPHRLATSPARRDRDAFLAANLGLG